MFNFILSNFKRDSFAKFIGIKKLSTCQYTLVNKLCFV